MSEYISPPIGNLLTASYKLHPNLLSDKKTLDSIVQRSLVEDGFTVLDLGGYDFSPGVTSTFTLSESHAAYHTYMEYDCFQFTLYSCRGIRDGRNVLDKLSGYFGVKPFYFNEMPVPVDEEVWLMKKS